MVACPSTPTLLDKNNRPFGVSVPGVHSIDMWLRRCQHHKVRTTLTLDDDVADLLQSEVRRSGEPLKETANRLLREGLRTKPEPTQLEPFVVKPIHAGLPPEWTSGCVQELLNILDEVPAE